MDSVKFVPLLVGLLLAVIMVGAVFVPVVQSSTTQTITTTIENEGSEWLKLGYNEGGDYSFTVGFDGEDNFSVGTQTGEYENLICYADNQRTLFVSGDYWYLLTNGESPSVYQFTDNASVTNASGTLTILDGSETVYTGASPTWAYVPDANGVYGFFTEGGLNLEEGKPKVAVGSYAGVFAYNDTVVSPNGYGDLGLTMSGDYADGEVIWIVAPSELDTLSALPTDTLEPAVIDLDPISIQPIDLGGSDSVGLMAISPGSYTDGDWTFNISGTNATIISYTGNNATNLVVPNTVSNNGNTYQVTRVGSGNPIVENTQLSPNGCTLTLPTNTIYLGNYAFKDCANLTGTVDLSNVNLPSNGGYSIFENTGITEVILKPGVTYESLAFKNTKITNLVIPAGCTFSTSCFANCTELVSIEFPSSWSTTGNGQFAGCTNLKTLKYEGKTSIPYSMFKDCSALDGLVVNSDITSIGDIAFQNCTSMSYLVVAGSPSIGSSSFDNTGIIEVLNLGETEITTTSYGLNADSVQDHVTALGYIAPTSISETEIVPIDSPVAGLMQMLPLIAGVGALLLAVGTMIYTRF